MFLALPTDCPTQPDGSYRKVQSGSARNSVVLYASDDEGLSFEQVPRPASHACPGCHLGDACCAERLPSGLHAAAFKRSEAGSRAC